MKYILAITITILLSSCGLFYRVVFNIKNPQFESYSSLNAYARKLTLDTSNVAFAKDTASITALTREFSGYQDILIFNRAHKYVPYKGDSVTCNASVDTIFKRICRIEENDIITAHHINFDKFIHMLDNHNHALDDIHDPKYDYIVFADYAKFFPKVNKNHIPGWDKAIKSNHGTCKTKIIYVDLDYLDSWHLPKDALPKLNLSSNKK